MHHNPELARAIQGDREREIRERLRVHRLREGESATPTAARPVGDPARATSPRLSRPEGRGA